MVVSRSLPEPGQHETAARLHDGDVGRKTAEKKFVC